MPARLRTASARLDGGPGDVPVAAVFVAVVAARPAAPQ